MLGNQCLHYLQLFSKQLNRIPRSRLVLPKCLCIWEPRGLVTGLCVASQSMVLHVGIMQRCRCWQDSPTPVLCPWVRLENILIISDWQESCLLKILIVLFLHAFLFNMFIVDKWPLFIAKEATLFWLLIRSKAQQMLRVSLTVSGWK